MPLIFKKNMIMMKSWRIRVTNACNAKCSFCHGESVELSKNKLFISTKFLRGFVNENIDSKDSVAITGGEPLLHPNIAEIIDIICSKVDSNFHLNSNGILLGRKLNILKDAKLKEIHLNVASFESNLYKKLYGVDLPISFSKSIVKSQKAGIEVTINCVLIKNINDADSNIVKMIEFAQMTKCNLAFIEEYSETYCDKSKGIIFQNRFEVMLLEMGYELISVKAGRKNYKKHTNFITIAAPCAPHFAWNSNEFADSFVVMEDQKIKKFSNAKIIEL